MRLEVRFPVMSDWYAEAAPEARQQGTRRVVRTLADLLDLAAPDPLDSARYAEASDWDAWIHLLSDETEQRLAQASYGHGAEETRALICGLASRPARGLESLISDLAEILVLPRRSRSEYVSNRLASPPYRISKLMLEFAVKALPIDLLLTGLTKTACATACDRLPMGCCRLPGYDLGLVPQGMLDLQALEARWRGGWAPPPVEETCQFHTPAGCVLQRFKSPACVGYLCEILQRLLAEQFRAALLQPFLEALAVFRNCDIDRCRVFEAMDRVIVTGRALQAG